MEFRRDAPLSFDGLVVYRHRTPPSQGGKMGSIPIRAAKFYGGVWVAPTSVASRVRRDLGRGRTARNDLTVRCGLLHPHRFDFLAGLPASSSDDRGEWFSKSASGDVV